MIGRMLADLGAEVIKVERPGMGDITRTVQPAVEGQSVYYAQMNAGKRGVCIDLRHEQGASIVASLAAHCDVFVENFRPGVLARRGLDATTLRAAHPRLVYCSVSAWGQDGPWTARRGYAPLIHAQTGLIELSGRLRDRPAEQEVHVYADLYTGFFATSAVLAALYQRTVTDEGQHLDVSMAEAFVYGDDWAAVDLHGMGRERFFDIWNHPVVVLGDGSQATIVANPDRNAEKLIEALAGDAARDAFLADPRCATEPARHANREHVLGEIRRVARTVPDFATLEARFEAAGQMAAEVRSVAELAATDWAADRGVFAEVEPGVRVPARPWRSDAADIGVRGPGPRQGEHTDDVLRDLLGADDDTIAAWRAAGAIV